MKKILLFAALTGFLLLVFQVGAQQIIIDKPIKAGDLTLFPEMGNENVYYYLSDQLRLATDGNGRPQFSFLKYVENVKSVPGADDITEGLGGGIVHMVISMEVSPEQLSAAKAALHQLNPDAVIQGPVIYSGGTLSVVSSFTNTEGEYAKQVVGFGKAPLIDGQKAAISIDLTKKGALLLWQSFQTPTPDVSFSLEMELEGYRSPKKAMIEADFDKIYSHHGFQAGAVGNYGNMMFGGEIELAFDELRNSGAIKVTSMGSDQSMDSLIATAYNKLTKLMFDPIGTGNPVLQSLMKGITGQKSALDRATDLYKLADKKASIPKTTPASKTTPAKTTGIDGGFAPAGTLWAFQSEVHAKGPYDASLFNQLPMVLAPWTAPYYMTFFDQYVDTYTYLSSSEISSIKEKVKKGEDVDFKALRQKNISEAKNKGAQPGFWYDMKVVLNQDEYAEVEKLLKKDSLNIYDVKSKYLEPRLKEIQKTMTFLTDRERTYCEAAATISVVWAVDFMYGYYQYHKPLLPETGLAGPLAEATAALLNDNPMVESSQAQTGNPKEPGLELPPLDLKELGLDTGGKGEDKVDKTKLEKELDAEKKRLATLAKEQLAKNPPEVIDSKSTTGQADAKKATDTSGKKEAKSQPAKAKEEKKTDFKMAVMAAYQFKQIKQKGRFNINLNKYSADKIVLRFDENIGSVNCPECFTEVNLDDPQFKQREIIAMLDGFNYDDFGKYINYVNLKMKKTHQDGAVTMDEVRIDRDHFTQTANHFKLMYGWKGDNDRLKWLDYEIQTHWSFFGGYEASSDWQQVNTNVVNLAAPYLHRTIELEADPELLKEQQVRSVNVKVYYQMGNQEQVQQVTLLPSRDQYSAKVDVMLPPNNSEYEYEISWRLFGNKTQSSGRLKSSESILFVDEIQQ